MDPIGVNPQLKEVFANKLTESVYGKYGDAAANVGKIWYMPGEYKDDFTDTAFGSYKGMPDVETPIAKFTSHKDETTSVASLQVDFYDSWEDKQYEWLSLIERFGTAREAYRQLDTPSVAAIVNKTTVDSTKALTRLKNVMAELIPQYIFTSLKSDLVQEVNYEKEKIMIGE